MLKSEWQGLQFITMKAKATQNLSIGRGILIKPSILSVHMLVCSSRFIRSSSFAKCFSSLKS